MSSAQVTVWTEDSGKAADDVAATIVRRTLKWMLPPTSVRPRVQPAAGASGDAFRGNRWLSRSSPNRRALIDDMARRLRQGDVLVLHVDGDTPWSHDGTTGAHDGALRALMDDVRRRLEAGPSRASTQHDPPPPVTGRVLWLVPHYSVESWLFVHHERVDLAREAGTTGVDAKRWLTDHHLGGGYDHLPKPKDACPGRARWNGLLAEHFNAEATHHVSPSYRRVVAAWNDSEGLKLLRGKTEP